MEKGNYGGKVSIGLLAGILLFIASCTTTDSLLEKGEAHLTLGDFTRAERCFSDAINRVPRSRHARLGLGKALLQRHAFYPEDTGLIAEALVQLEAARTLHPDSTAEKLLSIVWCQRAEVSLGSGDSVAALKALSRSTSLDPESTKPLNMAAILYFHRGESLKAINLFRLITTIDTASVSGWFNMGMVFWADSSYRQAADAFFKAAQRSPDDKEVLQWAARAKKYSSDIYTSNPGE